MRSPPHRILVGALLGALITAGCPRRFDPRAQEIRAPRSQDAERYRRALAALDEGDAQRARELAAPLAQSGEATEVAESARYVLGVASYRLGDFAAARALLRPLADRIAGGEDATELHAILADLARRDGQAQEALRSYERFYRGARPVEQAYVRGVARALIAGLPAEEQGGWRQRFELEPVPTPAAPASTVGIVVPLTGRDRALGERVLRGALLGLGLLGPAAPAPLELRVRDSGSSPERAATAAAELLSEGVLALIGSPARAEQAQVSREAQERGVPIIDVSPPAAEGAPQGAVLQLTRGSAARVRALARHLAAEGLRTVAIVAPATAYGKAMTRAAVEELGGRVRVLAELSFPERATTFTDLARQLARLRPEALLLPVSVVQLELLAAQLAASSVIPTQGVTGAVKPGVPPPSVRLVLSTAEGLGERLLRNAGRYLQGAVLAPLSIGGLPSDAPGLGAPAERYRQVFGEEPGPLDALGHDAARLVAGACEAARARPCSAEALRRGLQGLRLDGATGVLAFGPDGQRAGPPLLVRLDGNTLRVVSGGKLNYNGAERK